MMGPKTHSIIPIIYRGDIRVSTNLHSYYSNRNNIQICLDNNHVFIICIQYRMFNNTEKKCAHSLETKKIVENLNDSYKNVKKKIIFIL